MSQKTYQVHGMHCASCAVNISKAIQKLPGVTSCEVNYATEKAKIAYTSDALPVEVMNAEISKLGYSLQDSQPAADMHGDHMNMAQPKSVKLEELAAMKTKADFVMPVTLVVFVLMMWDIAAKIFFKIPNLPIPMQLFNTVTFLLSAVVLFWVGAPFIKGVGTFIVHRAANMDTLVGIGTLTAFVYSSVIFLLPQVRELLGVPEYTYFDVTIVVIGFVTFGKYLETRAKIKTGDAIEKLLSLQAKTAFVIRDGREIEVAIASVVHGDILSIKPGAKIPVDGVVVDGHSYVDEALVTGEPMPEKKEVGDTVTAGTINTTGAFTFRATKVGSETMLARIIAMVEEAQGSRAPIQALADKISAVFVPVVLVFAVMTLVTWLIIGSQYFGFSQAVSYGLVSFVSILVIACPCALGLATPTAIIVGVGKGARAGILVKDAATLEKLHQVTTVMVDKTGTLTKGKPALVSVNSTFNISDKEIVAILASLESQSEHPIAQAIVAYARENKIATEKVEGFDSIKGKGIKGNIGGTLYYAGNAALARDLKLTFDVAALEVDTKKGRTPIILATAEKVLGICIVADEVKPEAKQAVADLHKMGVKVIMLSGDDKNTATAIAEVVGIDEVVAEVLPEDKLKKIKELQQAGEVVAMAGDGVNDAPALAQADVGIAMATGTDAAIESAGITLLNGDISKLVKAVKLSKITMRGIKQNLFWAFAYNVVGIPLAAGIFYPLFGWLLNPVFAGLAMAFSSVSVVTNSLRLKTKKL